MVRPMVTSEKHFIQTSLNVVAAGAMQTQSFAIGVAAVDKNLNTEVAQGSIIKAIYLEYWVSSDDAAQGTFIWVIEKIQKSDASVTVGEIAGLNAYDNKRNVLQSGMGLMGNNVQFPSNLVKGWIKIPKGKQRFALGDVLKLSIFVQTNGMNTCGFAIYKEYT